MGDGSRVSPIGATAGAIQRDGRRADLRRAVQGQPGQAGLGDPGLWGTNYLIEGVIGSIT
jgi:hypothetical protein